MGVKFLGVDYWEKKKNSKLLFEQNKKIKRVNSWNLNFNMTSKQICKLKRNNVESNRFFFLFFFKKIEISRQRKKPN